MESLENPATFLPQRWAGVLDRIQQALTLAEAAAEQREKALPTMKKNGKPPSETVSWQLCLERLQSRLNGLGACAEKAQQGTAEVEKALAEEAGAILRWLSEEESVAQRLADRAGHTVG